MTKNWKRFLICAAIAVGSVILTVLMGNIRFFQLLDLKAQDAHFVLRGQQPTKDILLIGIDDKALNAFPELYSFWHPYYADAIKGAADGGAKVLVLDVAFGIPVARYEPNNDGMLAEAYTYAAPKMPVVSAFVPSKADQSDPNFMVPLNMMAAAFGTAAMANLTVDSDDFVRRQELIEAPKPGVPVEMLTRSMPLRAAEKFIGKDVELRNGKIYLDNKLIPTDDQRTLTLNFAGPADTFPRVSLYDFVKAVRAHDQAQIEKWVKGKVVLLGPDNNDDRHATPFYTAFSVTNKWRTPGVEIHANTLNTILSGKFLQPVPYWLAILALLLGAIATVSVVVAFTAVSHTGIWATGVLLVSLTITHIAFRMGWLLSTTNLLLAFLSALIGGVIYRFATAEKKSSFFKSAVALFVGKQVATSLDQSDKISLTGKQQQVTILFSDIRGFTAFCEGKEPGLIVDLLNVYMAMMCTIIVEHHGHVNKFIGDGILAVFSDDDEGAKPGDHALRAVQCAVAMVTAPSQFKSGTGLHTGDVVIGNVGSKDKMEFTVLGDTVNLASRLESLNKENKTKVLLSEETRVMCGDAIDTVFIGSVPVRGKTEPMNLYTIKSLAPEKKVEEKKQEEAPKQDQHAVAGAKA